MAKHWVCSLVYSVSTLKHDDIVVRGGVKTVKYTEKWSDLLTPHALTLALILSVIHAVTHKSTPRPHSDYHSHSWRRSDCEQVALKHGWDFCPVWERFEGFEGHWDMREVESEEREKRLVGGHEGRVQGSEDGERMRVWKQGIEDELES
ncbi:hypothetical protein CMV_006320 [Castanea mollissima]|uniref:Uncharacterized protein n=1 Tax=Castanea mollissima TaxID=60419 RepID=A0A8J4RP29_9ROSI|nr:hypothetical protein CMV_006320 [Castanea mollissima]